nr:immunoglobulin light chain junction region [Macaca mulatta]
CEAWDNRLSGPVF